MSYKLRPMTLEDSIAQYHWKQKLSPVNLFGTPFADVNYTPDDHDEWVKQFNEEGKHCNDRVAIVDEDSNDLVGFLYLRNADLENMRTEVSVWVGNEEHQNNGAGTYALFNMLYLLFTDLKLNKVYTKLSHTNIGPIHFYKKNGFVKEGTDRACMQYNGFFVDIVHLSMLKEEFFLHLQKVRKAQDTSSGNNVPSYLSLYDSKVS